MSETRLIIQLGDHSLKLNFALRFWRKLTGLLGGDLAKIDAMTPLEALPYLVTAALAFGEEEPKGFGVEWVENYLDDFDTTDADAINKIYLAYQASGGFLAKALQEKQ